MILINDFKYVWFFYYLGVAVGGGWQALVAYINLFSYYVIGLPLGFLLGYKTSLGVEVIVIAYTYIMLCHFNYFIHVRAV